MIYFIVINYMVVLLYGILISFSIAGIKFSKKNIRITAISYLMLIFIEAILYYFINSEVIIKLYPLLVHIPLILLIYLYFHRPLLLSIFSVSFGYMFCTPRKWIGSLVALIFFNNEMVGYLTQVIVSIPIFLLIHKYISPQIKTYIEYSKVKFNILFLIPIIYYFIDYSTAIYTKIFYKSTFFTNALIPTLLIIIYIIFSFIVGNQSANNYKLIHEKELLEIISAQAKISLENMKEHEKQVAIQRHDIKHHLQYIMTCINEDKKDIALSYISSITTNINQSSITRYCKNENINLIISSYISRISSCNIPCKTSIIIKDNLPILDMDFCCLFGNSIENAINACNKINNSSNRFISISILESNNKLCIEITNSYNGHITFQNNIPVRHTNNQGYGTKSIANIVDKYNGLYTFQAKNSSFVLRIII